MKLWGVWYADYSNSSVDERVFSAREDAVAVCRASGGLLQEFELDTPLDDKERAQRAIRPGESVYWCGIDLVKGARMEVREEPEKSAVAAADYLSVRIGKDGIPRRLIMETWATDKQHAAKILSERKARWIALGSQIDQRHRGHSYDYGWRRTLPSEPIADEADGMETGLAAGRSTAPDGGDRNAASSTPSPAPAGEVNE